jgi:hypothetical protein
MNTQPQKVVYNFDTETIMIIGFVSLAVIVLFFGITHSQEHGEIISSVSDIAAMLM